MRSLAILFLVGTAFAVPQYPQRIHGGEETTIEEYPFMSNMERLLSDMFWMQDCGGILVTDTSVLSSANCYRSDPVTSWRVRLGSSYATTGGSIHVISRILTHDQYDSNVDYDVAVIKLGNPAVLSPAVGLARIASARYILQDGDIVTSLGWGALAHNGPLAEQLQKVELNVINQGLCVDRYKELKTQPGYSTWPDVTPRMLCAGILDVGGKDSCQGDAGGPLLHNNVVVGITSWGFRCGTPQYPGVTSRVSALADWIVVNVVSG